MSAPILTIEDLKAKGKLVDGVLTFDLSLLPASDFDLVMQSLMVNGINLVGVGFNYNYLSSIKNDPNYHAKNNQLIAPNVIENSIWNLSKINKGHVTKFIVETLNRIFIKSKTIEVIELDSIELSESEFDSMAQTIGQCTSLNSIRINHMNISSESFSLLARNLHFGLRSLQIRGCHLEDSITHSFLDLINFHSEFQKKAVRVARRNKEGNIGIVCLSRIDFGENDFTDKFIEDVTDPIARSPIELLDLSSCHNISLSHRSTTGKIIMKVQPTLADLQAAEDENVRLREEVLRLTNGKPFAAIRSNIFAVGDKAEEFANHIFELDELHASLHSTSSGSSALTNGIRKKKKSIKTRKGL